VQSSGGRGAVAVRGELGVTSASVRVRSLVFCASLAAVAAPAALVSAHCRERVDTPPTGPCDETSTSPVLFWKRSCFTYVFNQHVFERLPGLTEQEVRDTFDQAFATWADVDCGNGKQPFLAEQSPGVSANEMSRGLLGVRNEALITAKTADEWALAGHRPGVLAVTLVWNDGNTGEILDVDMELNGHDGHFANCDKPCAPTEYDLLNTITHEAGHVLGLGHSMYDGKTMSFDARARETKKRALQQDDIDGYCGLDLPEHRCRGTDCSCPAAPIYSDHVATRRCSVRNVGARAGARDGGRWLGMVLLLTAGVLRLRSGRRR
jgi:hypothetical protein